MAILYIWRYVNIHNSTITRILGCHGYQKLILLALDTEERERMKQNNNEKAHI